MDSNAEDCELIEQVLQGDRSAFAFLVSRYEQSVFSTALAILGNRQDAEDVVQETFVAAFRKLDHFEKRSTFLTWLKRIAFNLAIDCFRRKRSRKTVANLEEANSIESDATDSPPIQLQKNELVGAIRNAIYSLSDDYRAIIVLRDMDGMDYQEISHVLELPIGTVRSRLHRARLELKAIMQQMGLDSWMENETSNGEAS